MKPAVVDVLELTNPHRGTVATLVSTEGPASALRSLGANVVDCSRITKKTP